VYELTITLPILIASLFAFGTGFFAGKSYSFQAAAIGVVLAQVYELTITLPILIASLFAFGTGFFAGKSYSFQAAWNGALVGIMGAMAGVLFGVMLLASNKVILIASTAFLIFMFLTQKWIEWQSNRIEKKTKPVKGGKNQPKAATVTYKGTIILAAVVVVFGAGILIQKNQIKVGLIGQPQTQTATIDEKNDLQVATVQVTRSGLSPKNTDFLPKQMIKAVINVEESAGTGLKLKSPVLGIDANLNKGENVFLMNNPQPGTYTYTVEPGGFKGTFTVK
ncbi:MFS transporter, partial [Paenibacillus sp. N3.4]|uniref:MFS transporter n=1 Tax=Paenibacillus sp. N3.4 TaxID=2603222 RepID=UPI00164FD489